MVPFKTDKNLLKLQELLSIFNENVTLKGNTLIYGKDKFVENTASYTIADKQFLNGEFDLYAIQKMKHLEGIALNIKGVGNEIDVVVTIPYEKLKEEVKTTVTM